METITMSWTRCLAILSLLALCNCGMVTASSHSQAGAPGGGAAGGGAWVSNAAQNPASSHTEKVYELRNANHTPARANDRARCRYCN